MDFISRRLSGKANIWTTGIVVSAILLIVFLLLQEFHATILSLDVKWLVVAAIPLIIALLRSNIIRSFKGFGIELETRLQEPIGAIALSAVDAVVELPGDYKETLGYIMRLSPEERASLQRLTFNEGRRNYYQPEVVREYLNLLPNLKYFEVADSKGKFVALVPVELFKLKEETNFGRIEDFIYTMVEKEHGAFFSNAIITETIRETENLLKALPVVRRSKYGLLPVVNRKGGFLGVITAAMIESKIADEVLAAQK